MTTFSVRPGEVVRIVSVEPPSGWPHWEPFGNGRKIHVLHRCRRGPVWCDWTIFGDSAVCTIGGEIASVGSNGEITKLEARRG